MSLKVPDPANEGQEIEVFTAEELAAKATEIEGIWKPKVDDLTGKLTAAETAGKERSREFGEFRKLSEEQVTKLDAAQRTIYENTLAIHERDLKIAEGNKKTYEASVDATIRAKIGNDPKLFDKAKAMYGLINLEDVTPEQMQQRVAAAVGALVQTEPDLLASIGVSTSGTYMPPFEKKAGEENFADTERGKAGAKELGIPLEAPAAK